MEKNGFKNLQLDLCSSDASMSQSESYELSLSGLKLKKYGIKISKNKVLNERTGDTFGGFIEPSDIIIQQQIGYGHGGSVHLAIHEPSETKLAIKSINIFEQEKRHQLVNELNSLEESMLCDNLVQCYGAYYDDGRVRLVLEYMDWGSLRNFMDKIKQNYPEQIPLLPEHIIGNIAYQIYWGLKYLHKERHHVHRDVKPENILINSEGGVKLTDFGISKQLFETINLCTSFTGTVAYMSPERMKTDEYSYPSDIWSLGLIIYEFATGHYAYPECKTIIEMRETMMYMNPPSLPNDGTFSDEMIDFVDKWLQIDVKDRLSTNHENHPWIERYANIDNDLQEWLIQLYQGTETTSTMSWEHEDTSHNRVSEADIENLGLTDLIGLK